MRSSDAVTDGHAPARRGVIYLDVGWHSLPTLIRRSLFTRESWYLRTSLPTPSTHRLLRLFNVRPIDLESPDALAIGTDSSEGPMLKALSGLQEQDLTPILRRHAEQVPRAANAERIMRAGVVRLLADRSLDAFYAQAWARTLGYTHVTFAGASPWDADLLRDREQHQAVVGAVARLIRSVLKALTRRRPRSSQRRAGAETEPSAPASPQAVPALGNPASARVLFVVNMGLVYGQLYAYDHVLSEDQASPLNPSNMAFLARSGGPANPEGIRHGFPGPGGRGAHLRRTVGYAIKDLARFGFRYRLRLVMQLARMSSLVDAQRASLAASFPNAEVAVLAYEMQVPIELVLSLEGLGIRSVALHERALSVVNRTQPFAVGDLLTASAYFSRAALASPSVAVQAATAVGMWRTDLLRDYQAREPHELATAAHERGQRFIVALPYHLDRGHGLSGNPIATSLSSVRHFIEDLLRLAEERPDLFIVIRGKNDDWVRDDRMHDLVKRVAGLANLDVSRDYGRVNESYRLTASADAVVAKYTSLVDEALAVGIPCIVHDYTANTSGFARPVVAYLPDQVWALDRDSLGTLVDRALADGGDRFREEWEVQRRQVFGDLHDGRVGLRAQGLILDMLGWAPDR